MYLYRFKVQGKYQFPVDMLRYDCCFPYESADVEKIEHTGDERGEVRLARYHSHKAWHPTVARWNSFGWIVTEEEKPYKV